GRGRCRARGTEGEVGPMRTRGLGVAGILMLWTALAPSVGHAQTRDGWPDGYGGADWAARAPAFGHAPVYRAQIDSAAGYAPPDLDLPLPLGNTRPESGFFVDGSFVLYLQTIPMKNQMVRQ